MPEAYWEAVLAEPVAPSAPRIPVQNLRLSEIPRHVLRVGCRRCDRIIEIQTTDAQKLYGQHAVWKDVGRRLLDDSCQQRTGSLADQAAEMRTRGEAMLRQADKLSCESWNERMWADGEPIDPSPTIDQAINGGYPWLQIECSRCKTPRDVDMAALAHPPTTCVHDLAGRLRCEKCKKAGKRPPATLLQVAPRARHAPSE